MKAREEALWLSAQKEMGAGSDIEERSDFVQIGSASLSLTGCSDSFKSSGIVRAVCLPNQEGCLAVQGDESNGE